jgi:DNA-binding NarL/FixJ family response regulator
MAAISVLVVDDHALFADALQMRLEQEGDLAPVRVAYDARSAWDTFVSVRPAVVILDVRLNGSSGIDLVGRMRRFDAGTNVVMLTAVESVDAVLTALSRGARAWLPKTIDTQHLVRVVRAVHRGEAWIDPVLLGQVLDRLVSRGLAPQPHPLARLTPRERQVLQCLVDGLSTAETAARLRMSANTLRTHTQNVNAKLGVHSTLESVAVALRNGFRAGEDHRR